MVNIGEGDNRAVALPADAEQDMCFDQFSGEDAPIGAETRAAQFATGNWLSEHAPSPRNALALLGIGAVLAPVILPALADGRAKQMDPTKAAFIRNGIERIAPLPVGMLEIPRNVRVSNVPGCHKLKKGEKPRVKIVQSSEVTGQTSAPTTEPLIAKHYVALQGLNTGGNVTVNYSVAETSLREKQTLNVPRCKDDSRKIVFSSISQRSPVNSGTPNTSPAKTIHSSETEPGLQTIEVTQKVHGKKTTIGKLSLRALQVIPKAGFPVPVS